MTRYHEGRTRVNQGRSSKAQWLPATAGLRDWRAQLDSRIVERIEAAAGQLLSAVGYRARYRSVSAAVREEVASVHEVFTKNALARDRALPRNWYGC
jgi:hypothetical protein